MTTLLIAALFAILGAVVYLVTNNKIAEVGRAAMWAGLFAVVGLLCGVFG